MLYNYVPIHILKNIIQFCFKANGKLNNGYSKSNMQYNTNLLNILYKEVST